MTEPRRAGRPPKVDDGGVVTRDRLLAAAADACFEHGFEGATLADIANRAQVSAPAIYNHFAGRVELLVAAGRWALEALAPDDGAGAGATEVVAVFLSDAYARTRRLLVELHLAGQRHPDVAELLAAWHSDHAEQWRPRVTGDDPDAVVTTFFALLLGLCHVESFTLGATTAAVSDQAQALSRVLFPEEEQS